MLALMTTEEGSSERFDALSTLLGDNIIGAVWYYASDNVDVVLASIEVLPPVVTALGIGTVRFLKVNIVLQDQISSIYF